MPRIMLIIQKDNIDHSKVFNSTALTIYIVHLIVYRNVYWILLI